MNTFTFNSKETYLAYRSEWKANYTALSQQIRELRQNIIEAQRNHKYAGSMQYQKFLLRKKATATIEELKESRIESQQQYLAAKEKEMVLT